MYHLKHLVSLAGSLKIKIADVKIAVCTDTVQILCITTSHRIFYRQLVYFEDKVTYFDKIFMFSYKKKQNDILKCIWL